MTQKRTHINSLMLLDRLFEKAIPEPNTGCWIWTGAATSRGYGHMWDGTAYEKAHRLSYKLHHGPIPSGMHVCHRCDNPSCINPDHLWLGTPRANVRDCIAKGRAKRGVLFGEASPSAKLSSSDVDLIRSVPLGYGTGVALARRFGVRPKHISMIRCGKMRPHG